MQRVAESVAFPGSILLCCGLLLWQTQLVVAAPPQIEYVEQTIQVSGMAQQVRIPKGYRLEPCIERPIGRASKASITTRFGW
jgi:hypothetical protein